MPRVTINAPYFCASLFTKQGLDLDERVERAAPIIKYMIGWDINKVLQYCDKKGWKIVE